MLIVSKLLPENINELRKLAGVKLVNFSVYYNLGGPHAGKVEGRQDMEPAFFIEMTQDEYDAFEDTYGTGEKAYVKLVELHSGTESIQKDS